MIFSVLLTFSSVGWGFAKDAYPKDTTIDVQHYVFELEVFPDEQRIEGNTTIDILFTSGPADAFALDLDDINDDQTGMQVTGVLKNGSPVTYTHENDRLTIESGAAAGTKASYTIQYSGRPFDGLIMKPNQFGKMVAFGDNWPDRARHWLACVDHPSDKATMEFKITGPRDFKVIANGSLIGEDRQSKGRMLTHWKMDTPIPMKVAVLGMAEFAVQESGKVGNVPVTSWIYDAAEPDGFRDFASAPEILNFFVEYIGEYPYEKLANVQSTTRYGGMENAGNIFYDESVVDGNADNDKLLAHEIAHQWFGNSVTENDWHHVWLSEGFATYLTMIYVENSMGIDAMKQDLEAARDRVVAFYEKNKRLAVVDTTLAIKEVLSPYTYQKAAWVLHMLRQKIGDAAFHELIRQYFQTYRDENALTGDFQQLAEEISGMDLGYFFDRWLMQPGVPDIQWQWRQSNAGDRIYVRISQKQALAFNNLKMDLAIYLQNEKEPILETIDVGYTAREYSYRLPGEIDRVELDPDRKVLFKGPYVLKDPAN